MQTRFSATFLANENAAQAEDILRRCVHCGFCNATCPTYQVKGDELDGPRGRIYLIKQMLEQQQATAVTLNHLDRCLTCRNCESTCPSGVRYADLLAIGFREAERFVSRPLRQRLMRNALMWLLPEERRFAFVYAIARGLRRLLPRSLRSRILAAQPARVVPVQNRERQVILLQGCVHDTLDARIHADTAFVLDKIGVQCLQAKHESCCGALEHHLQAERAAMSRMKRNIDAWWPLLQHGAEAIISNSSACGLMVQKYVDHFASDAEYAEKARLVSAKCIDIMTFLEQHHLPALRIPAQSIVVHSPCTLQHGQGRAGQLEVLIDKLGFNRVHYAEAHLCCGSAGAYSLLQPDLSRTLTERKLANIQAAKPELIVSANIGCISQLAQASPIPVKHWISLVAESIA